MWQPVLNATQLQVGGLIRKSVTDGDFLHESIYKILNVEQFYFVVQIISQNGLEITFENQIITPYRIEGILYYGFEIWVE